MSETVAHTVWSTVWVIISLFLPRTTKYTFGVFIAEPTRSGKLFWSSRQDFNMEQPLQHLESLIDLFLNVFSTTCNTLLKDKHQTSWRLNLDEHRTVTNHEGQADSTSDKVDWLKYRKQPKADRTVHSTWPPWGVSLGEIPGWGLDGGPSVEVLHLGRELPMWKQIVPLYIQSWTLLQRKGWELHNDYMSKHQACGAWLLLPPTRSMVELTDDLPILLGAWLEELDESNWISWLLIIPALSLSSGLVCDLASPRKEETRNKDHMKWSCSQTS